MMKHLQCGPTTKSRNRNAAIPFAKSIIMSTQHRVAVLCIYGMVWYDLAAQKFLFVLLSEVAVQRRILFWFSCQFTVFCKPSNFQHTIRDSDRIKNKNKISPTRENYHSWRISLAHENLLFQRLMFVCPWRYSVCFVCLFFSSLLVLPVLQQLLSQ